MASTLGVSGAERHSCLPTFNRDTRLLFCGAQTLTAAGASPRTERLENYPWTVELD
jgi:hypothetical protein